MRAAVETVFARAMAWSTAERTKRGQPVGSGIACKWFPSVLRELE
jgi:hypothetical protein